MTLAPVRDLHEFLSFILLMRCLHQCSQPEPSEPHAIPSDSKRPFQHFSISAFHRPAAPQNCKSPLFLRGSLRWARNSKSCFPANEILTRMLTRTCIDNLTLTAAALEARRRVSSGGARPLRA